ncbi:MAG TPA: SMC-Scp complex subunit ScpB [Chitinophagaceae bacterium]|nr:SMC-Scp complex subunit ScpB [Chitinophagaceae bacterium]HNF71067.1 SMC-Scp complex subunit ScpB [Chitinophagaceae bacterium]
MTIEQIMLESESLIFGSNRPLTAGDIGQILKDTHQEEEQPDDTQLESALEAIVEKYASDFYPFEVKQIGGGYQFLSKKSFYPTLSKLNGDKFNKRLSAASMETLAIIAYRQPITKGEIEHIRGVNSDYSVQKLLEKELIVISGRMEEMVGKPLTYSTSRSFMDYLGLNSLDELPKLNEIIKQDLVMPTPGTEAIPEGDHTMAVGENGELIHLGEGEVPEQENGSSES